MDIGIIFSSTYLHIHKIDFLKVKWSHLFNVFHGTFFNSFSVDLIAVIFYNPILLDPLK